MAVTEQRVLADLGSDEVRLTREQANAVTTWIEAFRVAVAGSVDYATLKAAIAALDYSAFRTLTSMPNIPAPRRFPTV